MDSTGPIRHQSDLAEMIELLLDKGVVINADIVVSIGDTELLGVELRAAIASFETAAKYGLEFPEGTDRERIEEAAERGGHPARQADRSAMGRRPRASARPGHTPEEGIAAAIGIGDDGETEADEPEQGEEEDVESTAADASDNGDSETDDDG